MHIPNGFLTDPVCTVTALAATGALGVGVMRLRREGATRSSALMAATGAGIFAAQMVNVPIDSATSGHFLGSALAAIVLGPWQGMLTMATVLAVQCLLFGDGGLSALGANTLNMAVAGTLVAAVVYQQVSQRVAGSKGILLASAMAAFASVMAAAGLCAVELTASGNDATQVFPAMLGIHAVIGLAEAAMTLAIVGVVLVIRAGAVRSWTPGRVAMVSLAVAVFVAGALAPFASSAPDGLEHVALSLNLAEAPVTSWALAPDYEAPGVSWPALAVALAGIAGAVFVFVSTYTVGRTTLVRVPKEPANKQPGRSSH